jgi:hypothetical protein
VMFGSICSGFLAQFARRDSFSFSSRSLQSYHTERLEVMRGTADSIELRR